MWRKTEVAIIAFLKPPPMTSLFLPPWRQYLSPPCTRQSVGNADTHFLGRDQSPFQFLPPFLSPIRWLTSIHFLPAFHHFIWRLFHTRSLEFSLSLSLSLSFSLDKNLQWFKYTRVQELKEEHHEMREEFCHWILAQQKTFLIECCGVMINGGFSNNARIAMESFQYTLQYVSFSWILLEPFLEATFKRLFSWQHEH